MRFALLREFGLKVTDNEELKQNPYLELGYAVNAYMDLNWYFLRVFSWLALVAVPLFYIYSTQGHTFTDNFMGVVSYPQVFLGNLGGASVYCAHFLLE